MTQDYEIKQKDLINFKKRKYVRNLCARAIRKGELVRAEACECCAQEAATQAHHIDYGKPYDVMWLCSACHGEAHRGDSELNPKNNYQTPAPECVELYKNINISFTIPIKTFLHMQFKADEKNISVSRLIRDHAMENYPICDGQLNFKF